MNELAKDTVAAYVAAHRPSDAAVAANLRVVEARISAGEMGVLPLESATSAGAGAGRAALAAKAFVAGAILAGAIAYGLSDTETAEISQISKTVETGETGEMADLPAIAPRDDVTAQLPAPGITPHVPAQGGLTDAEGNVAAPQGDGATTSDGLERSRSRTRSKGKAKGPARTSSGGSSGAAAPPPVSGLREEMALLAEGQRALQAGRPAEALRQFERHRTRFPKGIMGTEREAKTVVALCELGRVDEARKRRARFLRSHPASPLAASLAEVCRGE